MQIKKIINGRNNSITTIFLHKILSINHRKKINKFIIE